MTPEMLSTFWRRGRGSRFAKRKRRWAAAPKKVFSHEPPPWRRRLEGVKRKGKPTGDGTPLEPGRGRKPLRVRLPLLPLDDAGSVGNPADHPCSDRGMLWVQLPPEPLSIPWRTSPEWSSLSQGEERGFKSHPG